MDEEEKTPEATKGLPPPATLREAPAADHDPRVAAVLRAVHRAKGSVSTSTTFPRTDDELIEPVVTLGIEVRALREEIATKAAADEKILASVSLDARSMRESVAVLRTNVTDLQRSVSVATETHQHQAREAERQVSALVDLHVELKRALRNWAIVVSVVLGGCVAVAARVYWLARDTHDVLVQILEANQAKAQAAKGARR